MPVETNQLDGRLANEAKTVLVVDDEPAMRSAITESLRRKGYDVVLASDGREALELLADVKPWLAMTDMRMPRLGGLQLVKELKKRAPAMPVVVMTAYGSVETAVEAIKLGAYDYVLKPFAAEMLDRILAALEEPATARQTLDSLPGADARSIVTQDPGMLRLLNQLEGIAASQATVLMYGESGTGKEMLARFIHQRSPRAHRPFVAVNCAALPDGLLESELFGHERGAFTGAIVRKIGKFEMAHTGTLLLDELSEMNLGLQAKLLRVLQEREVDRVGGLTPVQVNMRVIATTNRPLLRDVETGRFREDLYYRLNVFPITVPPLRDRCGDIPMLARHFAQAAAKRNGLPVPLVPDEVVAMLQQRPWKGNIRELENVIERAVLLASGGTVEAQHLLLDAAPTVASQALPAVPTGGSTTGSLWEMERVDFSNAREGPSESDQGGDRIGDQHPDVAKQVARVSPGIDRSVVCRSVTSAARQLLPGPEGIASLWIRPCRPTVGDANRVSRNAHRNGLCYR
jgi:two-component system response regulator FlrC